MTRSPSADLRKRIVTIQCAHSLQFLEVYSLLFNSLENDKGDRYNIMEIILIGSSVFLFLNFYCDKYEY
jgi:hypothetical protein